MFSKATKAKARLRLALSGPSGSGKTYSALNIAKHLGRSIAVIDTERGSASKYAGLFNFDVCDLTQHHPSKYVEAIKAADTAGYDVIVIDSLSHAWFAQLEIADGQFGNWKNVRPLERALIDAILSCSCHVIVTMRSKTEWAIEDTVNRSGKTVKSPKKLGMGVMQSSGIEYEFDIAGEMDLNHMLTLSKSRCPELANSTHLNPGSELAKALLDWLSDGETIESGAAKRNRVKVKRSELSLEVDAIVNLIKTNFSGKSDPNQLSTEEVDRLIELMGVEASLGDWNETPEGEALR